MKMHVRILIFGATLLAIAVLRHLLYADPDKQPDISTLAGTWVPAVHHTRPPTEYLRLNGDHTFMVAHFPVSPSSGAIGEVSGTGTWQLSPSNSAFLVKFTGQNFGFEFRVVGRRSPFLLVASVNHDDETLRARRLEDSK